MQVSHFLVLSLSFPKRLPSDSFFKRALGDLGDSFSVLGEVVPDDLELGWTFKESRLSWGEETGAGLSLSS